MKNPEKSIKPVLVLGFLFVSLFAGCSKDGSEMPLGDIESNAIGQEDQNALLFMLEEEKLARDTYVYLGELWGINVFSNIKNSEQSHMDAVVGLLNQYKIPYSIMPDGQFANQEIQALYDRYVIDGSINETKALEVGATIEDMDIVDLENYLVMTNNIQVIAVFESLQCGSRNHLRSFTSTLDGMGMTYVPQYLAFEDYNAIINDSKEQCGR